MDYYVNICTRELDGYESDLSAFAAHASLHDIDPPPPVDIESWAPNLVFGPKNHTYKKWLEGHLSSIALHLTGPAGSGKSLLAYESLRCLQEKGSRVIAYAVPQRTPGQTFTTRNLFASLCKQALLSFPNAKFTRGLCDYLFEKSRVRYSKEAFRALLCSLLSSHTEDSVFCIIHGIGNLPESCQKELAHDIEIINSHAQRPMNLLLTSGPGRVADLGSLQHEIINLADHQEFCTSQGRRFMEMRIKDLENKRLLNWKPVIPQLFDLTESFPTRSNMSDLATKFDLLKHMSGEINANILASLILTAAAPPEIISRQCIGRIPARDAINRSGTMWIQHSVRQLTPAELVVCCAMDHGGVSRALDINTLKDRVSRDLASSFGRSELGFLCHVLDGKVHLRPNRDRDRLLSEESKSWKHPPDNQVHYHLFSRCLEHLTVLSESWRASGFEPTSDNLKSNSPVVDVRSFTEYVVLHWPDHCRRALDQEARTGVLGGITARVESAASKAKAFLQNRQLFKTWLEVYSIYGIGRHRDGQAPKTPLQVAAYFRLNEVLDLLTDSAQVANQFQTNGSLTIQFAASVGNYGGLKILESEFPAPRDMARVSTAIRGGIQEVVHEVFRELMAGNTDSETKIDINYAHNLLLEAARHGHNDILKELLELMDSVMEKQVPGSTRSTTRHVTAGVEPSIKFKMPELSALDVATRIGNQPAAQMLVEAGYNVGPRCRNALLFAAEGGFYNIAEMLTNSNPQKREYYWPVDSGPDQDHFTVYGVNLALGNVDNDGNTPLHLAASKGHARVVYLLISRNADPSIKNKKGQTALHIAAQYGFVGVARAYIEAFKFRSRHLNNQANSAEPDVDKDPLDYHALEAFKEAIQTWDPDGNSSLHLAAEHGHSEVLSCFLDSEKDPNNKDLANLMSKLGYTPLHLASKAGHVKACEVLLEMGALPNVLSSAGTKPLDEAINGNWPDVVPSLEIWEFRLSRKR